MRSRIVSPALVVLSLVAAGPARAAVKEAVVVVPADPGSASAAPAVARALEAWSAKSGRYSPVSVAEKAMGDGPATRQAAAKTGAAKLQAGLTAYDSLSYDEALADLDAAAKAYLDSDIRDHLQGLLNVYGARVLALYYAGKVADARNQLIDIFTLDHDYAFDKTRMTPDVQQVVNGVRATQAKVPTTSLEVQTSPANAQVWVDGNYVGVSPAEAKGLTTGYHLVTVVRPGYAFSQSRQLAAPGKLVEVKLQAAPGQAKLDALLKGVAVGFKKQAWSRPEAALARWAGAKQVLAVSVRTGSEKGLHLDAARVANDGHLLAVSSADVPSGGGLAQAVMAFAAGIHKTDRPRGPNGEPITTLSTGLSLGGPKLYGAILGGVGVAAIVGGVVMGLSANGTAAKARAVPQLDDALYQKTLSQARGQALVADILYAVGIVGAGVGSWLLLKPTGGAAAPSNAPAGGDVFSLAPVPVPGGAAVMIHGSF